MLRLCSVLATRLRVSRHTLRSYTGSHLHSHDEEEGQVHIDRSIEGIKLTSGGVVAQYLEHLKGGKVPVEILVRGKDADENAKLFERLLDIIKAAGVRTINRDDFMGDTLTSR